MKHDGSKDFLSSLQEQFKEAFGEKFGHEFGTLLLEWWAAKRLYELYQDLFGAEEPWSLMNDAWGYLAQELQTLIHDSFMLHVCRLTDKKSDSLTLSTLSQYLSDEKKLDYQDLLNKATQASEFARRWRDKEIAHNDYRHFKGTQNFVTTSGEDVNACLEALGDCLTLFDETTASMPGLIGYDGDLDRYLRILKLGLRADDAQHGSESLST